MLFPAWCFTWAGQVPAVLRPAQPACASTSGTRLSGRLQDNPAIADHITALQEISPPPARSKAARPGPRPRLRAPSPRDALTTRPACLPTRIGKQHPPVPADRALELERPVTGRPVQQRL